MREIDLDAVGRAQAEQEPEPIVAVLGGVKFELPSMPPATFLVGLGRMQRGQLYGFEDALRSLFGDRLDEALDAGLGMHHLEPIASAVYGIDLGEAPASAS